MITTQLGTRSGGGRRRSAQRAAILTLDRTSLTVAVVIAVQAAWLGVILGRGWYTDADLPNLGAATGVPLSWDYLTSSVGGHFGAPARLMYWILNRTAPLNWPLTVGLRLVLQAAGTYALWRLLILLVGRRPWIPIVLLVCGLSPLLVPGLAWLTSGLGLAIGQLMVCLMLIAWVRYVRSGSLTWAVFTVFWSLTALTFADQTLPCLILLPLLSLGFLDQGSLADRVRAERRRWVGWLLLALALGGYAAFYLQGSYNTGSNRFGLTAAWSISRSEWLEVIGPAFVGGPWRWSSTPDGFVSFSTPATPAVLTGQLAFFTLLVLSFRVRGWRAVLAWGIPLVIGVSSVVLVGKGRYDVLGTFVSPLLRYSFYLALALVLGVVLAFAPTLDEVAESSASVPEDVPDAERTSKPVTDSNMAPGAYQSPAPGYQIATIPRSAVAVAVVALLAASAYSSGRFSQRFWQNPAKSYVANLTASARSGGPNLVVYDNASPPTIAAYVEPNHFLSDILGLARLPVTYQGSAASPLVADGDGRFVPAVFFRSADSSGALKTGCGTYLRGAGTWRIPLSNSLAEKDWFLRLELYQPHDNTILVSVLDRAGRSVALVGGPSVHARGKIVAITRRIDTTSPGSILVRSTATTTNLCLVHTYVGVPLARGPR